MTIYEEALQKLLSGDPSPVEDSNLFFALNQEIQELLSKDGMTMYDIANLHAILHIANIVYNNFPIDDDRLFIDNGVYDLLLEKYRAINPKVQVGAEPIQFNYVPSVYTVSKNCIPLVTELKETEFFKEDLKPVVPIPRNIPLVTWMGEETGKKLRVVSHGNDTLVGTLDKCKFVLESDAEKAGVLDDPKVKILERDFFGAHFQRGIISPDMKFRMLLELKYDGVSVVVTIRNGYVVQAVSRGDTGMDAAIDYTPILYGYPFPELMKYGNVELDVKCEAVMTYSDLIEFNEVRGYSYKNARSAIIGLTGLNDGYKYRDYITLIPLKVAHSSLAENPTYIEDQLADRIEECIFLNEFLTTKEFLRYSYIEGDYTYILYMIKKFVEEAEQMRPYINVMYDGVVLSYLDKNLIEVLGRENFVNKWTVAIKFSTLKRKTKLLGITYTVGQNGVVTPMAHYQPIEFLGTVHTKSSISSYKRFTENHFKIGNVIQVEYINDVMPYVTTQEEDRIQNQSNPNPEIKFPKKCPSCGHKLSFSDKSAICTNIDCIGRRVSRMANMMSKLNLKGFAEESMSKLQVGSLVELMSLTRDQIVERLHSEVLANNLLSILQMLKTTPIYDYILIGALGFTNVSQGIWQLILREISIEEIVSMNPEKLYGVLMDIKGIGSVSAKTIQQELPIFLKDIEMILSWGVLIQSKGIKQFKIRVS